MEARNITKGIDWVGVVDWDRRLFDDLIPLPDGTSYNAFLIQGSEKTALIDTVDTALSHVLLERLSKLGIKHIDYIVINHAEPDHSGALPQILERYPKAQVACTPKCKDMLINMSQAPENRIIPVEDGATLSLGDRTLEFIHAKWVHWPETMFTYLKEDEILFSCDFFGSHLATTDLSVTDQGRVYEAAKRYYAEIMMPFRKIIQKHMKKLEGYSISRIAPSHGPMYDDPKFIIDAYNDWVFSDPKNVVVLPYISMHGTTRDMVNYLVDALTSKGVTVELFNMAVTDIGKLAIALVDAGTIVIGSPTVLTGAHPSIVYGTYLANALRPKAKYAAIIGSYGWGGRMVDQLASMIPNLKVEVLGTVVVKGYPSEDDFKSLNDLADTIANKHKENNFL
jgi:flavorubredoxin